MLAVAFPAFAQFTPISTPDAGYTGSTTLVAITPSDGTNVPTLSGGGQTVTLSTPLSAATVGGGGGWATWGSPPNTEGANPRVLKTLTALTSLTLTLSSPTTTFGLEIEPSAFSVHSVTVTFMNGSTTLGSVTRSVDGNAGALLFAATNTTPITSVVLSVPSAAGGFAIGQFRFALPSATSIPTASTTALGGLAMALLAGGALLARKQQMAS